MITTNPTRRTALAGTVALPAALAPMGLARAATTPIATDGRLGGATRRRSCL